MAVVHVHDSATLTPLRRYAEYTEGADVQVNLPKLALSMGHVSIVSTAHYLRWMPAVIEQATNASSNLAVR